ncbi:nitrate- and nitrite sensing domain-containing protein [Streptomyces sp. NPDC047108]|uniref:nitrate- and nitrite sensing domain-containing protein n=1 Tax=Streptomyces sp. NPDC047108 TaxID=3155025 RepID=UPI0033EFD009
MQKRWPRGIKRGSAQPAGGASDGASAPQRRKALVRNRLVGAVAVVGVAVLAAGAPGIAAASGDLTESQRLVSLSEVNSTAVVLVHSLADERDSMTEFVAAGRTTASGADVVSEGRRARVDRQIAEIRPDAPAALRRALSGLPKIRQEAISGRGSATKTFQAYTATLDAVRTLVADLARRVPPRASGPAEALPVLGRAVDHASATRGLLLAALSGSSSRATLTAAAQRTHVQSEAALADFGQTAPESAVERYANTVNGTEVSSADRYLARLTDQPQLSASDLRLGRGRVEAALSGRIDRMRAAESALTRAETERFAALRDDDVTVLELEIALAAVCLLLAVGISISAARSMTHPLAVLRRGARRVAENPAEQEPVRWNGRNDEFAEVVTAVNELHQNAVRMHARVERLGEDRTRLVGERQRLVEERDGLRRLHEELTERLEGVHERAQAGHVSLAVRTLGLVERQLGIIEGLEDREADPERLDTLFKLDHLATRMRRNSENLLVLAGAEHSGGQIGAPVPLLDVLRAAVSEIERYDRVAIHSLPPHAQVAGFAADAISHLVAELLENATAFSPPDAQVELSGWLMQNGEIMLSVQDEGIGVPEERIEAVNARLAEPDPASGDEDDGALGLGLYVVARLASRHGVRVQLRAQKSGGTAAVAVLPKSILPTRPAPAGSGGAGGPERPAVSLPGSIAEANSNTLPVRTPAPRSPQQLPGASPAEDPVVAAAERAIAAGESTAGTDAAAAGAPGADAEPAVAEPPATPPSEVTGTFPLPKLPAEPPADEPSPAEPPADVAQPDAGQPPATDGTSAPAEPVTPAPAQAGGPGPYAIGPDQHTHAEDEAGASADQATRDLRQPPSPGGPTAHATGALTAPGGPDETEEPAGHGGEPQWERVTDKGLPKRTPKTVAPTASAAQERTGPVNAEELRRRLGGFQRGARDGHRVAAQEIAGHDSPDHGTAAQATPAHGTPARSATPHATTAEEEAPQGAGERRTGAPNEGGTVEEARG